MARKRILRGSAAARNLVTVGLLIALLIGGLVAFYRMQLKFEERKLVQTTISKGNHLLGLISLYPFHEYDRKEQFFVMRTLSEYVSREGMQYVFVHDVDGKVVMSLVPNAVASTIPADIQTKSLHADAARQQVYQAGTPPQTIYEFAKPTFADGKRTGTVRLGMAPGTVPVFALERVSVLAAICLVIVAAVTIVYHLMQAALKHLRASVHLPGAGPIDGDKFGTAIVGIGSAVEYLDQAIAQLKERLTVVSKDNEQLSSQVGVLAFERNLMTRILDNLDMGVLILDFQQRVYQVNKYVAAMLGKTSAELADRPLSEVMEDEALLEYVQRHESTTLGRRPEPTEIELDVTAPNSLYRLSIGALQDRDGEPLAQMLLLRNITDQRATDQTKQDFVINLAHELLNPLTSVKAYTEMLLDNQVTDPETQKEFYNTISREVDRLEGLVKNFLNVSKMEVGGLTLSRTLVRCDWFVGDCLPVIEKAAVDKKITVERRLPDKYPSLYADKELLKVALVNVLGNAVKYTPEGGTVSFALWTVEDNVFFEVGDTGCGISEEDLPNIFEKFYRSGDRAVADQMGSGLGLAITNEIVRLHGGSIDVQSVLGEGTRIVFKVPQQEYYIGEK
jgi:PAS domain S-box-containing protein